MTDDGLRSPDPVSVAIGANVRAEMARRSVTQAQVSRIIGRSQQQVSERLLGNVDFQAKELVQIAELLGIATDVLVTVNESNARTSAA